jgi:hypothetical protein
MWKDSLCVLYSCTHNWTFLPFAFVFLELSYFCDKWWHFFVLRLYFTVYLTFLVPISFHICYCKFFRLCIGSLPRHCVSGFFLPTTVNWIFLLEKRWPKRANALAVQEKTLLKGHCHEIDTGGNSPPVSLIPVTVVHLDVANISRIFEKNWNHPNVIFRALGENDSWKNQKSKISWHCPFREFLK